MVSTNTFSFTPLAERPCLLRRPDAPAASHDVPAKAHRSKLTVKSHGKPRLANHGRRAGHRSPHHSHHPVGKIGNDRPITIVTEVWTSPELKTIVLSKRNDPRMGEQTFKLTNIQRSEPDPSLFTVPSDFTITEGGAKTIIYRTKP